MWPDLAVGPVTLELREDCKQLIDDGIGISSGRRAPQALQHRRVLAEPKTSGPSTAPSKTSRVAAPGRKCVFRCMKHTLHEQSFRRARTEVDGEARPTVFLPLHFEHLDRATRTSTETGRAGLAAFVHDESAIGDVRDKSRPQRVTEWGCPSYDLGTSSSYELSSETYHDRSSCISAVRIRQRAPRKSGMTASARVSDSGEHSRASPPEVCGA